MMIEPENEQLIPLPEVPNLSFMPTRNGRKVSVRTVNRWATSGAKGAKLETTMAGGKRCTTTAAVLRFFERVQAATTTGRPATPKQQAVSQRRAYAILSKFGLAPDGRAAG